MANKVKFGLKNVHVFPITDDKESGVVFGEVIKDKIRLQSLIPGTIKFSLADRHSLRKDRPLLRGGSGVAPFIGCGPAVFYELNFDRLFHGATHLRIFRSAPDGFSMRRSIGLGLPCRDFHRRSVP